MKQKGEPTHCPKHTWKFTYDKWVALQISQDIGLMQLGSTKKHKIRLQLLYTMYKN